jgi:DNA-directed RNA polymerase subunit beta
MNAVKLRLTYGMPFRIRVRLHRKDKDEIQEDLIYLGELPIMIGGGEFIINGAERVIVSQLAPQSRASTSSKNRPKATALCTPAASSRSGAVGLKSTSPRRTCWRSASTSPARSRRRLSCGRWIREFGSDEAIIKAFHKTKKIKPGSLKPEMYSVARSSTRKRVKSLFAPAARFGDAVQRIQDLDLKDIEVISKVGDPLILNTLADDGTRTHEEALLKIYARLRPGNPPHVEKARKLFEEKFFDENRYRLGKVGRFRLNRKLDVTADDSQMTLGSTDVIACLKYLLLLRTGESQFEVDDIDHLGNRRLRTIDELAAEELRKGFLKLRRTVTERMSLKNPDEISRIAELVNSKSDQLEHRVLLRARRAFAGRRPDQPAFAADARAPPVGIGTGRSEPQARRALKCATCTSRTTVASARSKRRKARTSV